MLPMQAACAPAQVSRDVIAGSYTFTLTKSALLAAGRREEALSIAGTLSERSRTQYIPQDWIAVIYNGLHDKQNKLPWLRKAIEERTSWLVWINVEPRFDWARGDPEISELLQSLHFPK